MLRRRSSPVTGAELLKCAVFDGFDYGLSFAYVEGLGRVLSGFKARCFRKPGHPLHNTWRIGKNLVHEETQEFFATLKAIAGESFVETYETFTRKLDRSREKPLVAAYTADLQVRIATMADGKVLARGDYHPGLIAIYRRMGGLYLGLSKAWKIACTAEALHSSLIDGLGLREEQVQILQGRHELLEDGALVQAREWESIAVGGERPEPTGESEDSVNEVYLASIPQIKPINWTPRVLEEALNQYQLYDYQRAGVAHLVQRSSALLADDMGLGKTRQSIVAAHIQAKGRPILIICLASLIINWSREILAVCPDAKISMQASDPSAQWIIINYERLGQFVTTASQYNVMVIDEAHRLKEPTAEWTRHAFDIASKVPNRYLLTGTPVLNRESELHTLLRLSGHPIGLMSLKAFCEQFAGSSEFRASLRILLSDWMLRRTKDVLVNLKGKQRQTFASQMSPAERSQYQEVFYSDKSPLARVGSLRSMLERFKTRTIVDMVRELDTQDKVIIFCEFIESVEWLNRELATHGIQCVTLTGKHSGTRRQKAVDQFQGDENIRAFIGTTAAAGTGINLTAANYVFFASLPWTPALQDQAEDRAYRNGQLRPVIVKIPLVDDSIDQGLWSMLAAKRAVARDLIEPDDAAQRAEKEFASALMNAA
ncbi:DEAD/DEAH box helicase [Pseudomonas sp. GXZC]|uniref:DEAD/DEAH box helicase n=1 Tax=Pseudomonas sp. GXZC TaxID=3003351 RepID=UPI0022AA5AC9|nr:DEAD/DEAH box helicase [Pseudomonas sp. GXZC]WAT32208.1 DEAD/DEAH box helicase [Pseudomonas sp. GXZC]